MLPEGSHRFRIRKIRGPWPMCDFLPAAHRLDGRSPLPWRPSAPRVLRGSTHFSFLRILSKSPPMSLYPVLIGKSEDAYRRGQPVAIVPDARRRHLAIFGGSGSGKSTLLRNMIAADIAAGHGVTVVDPHGQLVEEILDNHIPRYRTNDVIYFNAKDRERALSLNLLDCRRTEQRGLVVSNAIGIFKKLWLESWAPNGG